MQRKEEKRKSCPANIDNLNAQQRTETSYFGTKPIKKANGKKTTTKSSVTSK